jgi:hypothetical protein
MLMAIGSRSRAEAAPLKIGASPSLLSGLEPEIKKEKKLF